MSIISGSFGNFIWERLAADQRSMDRLPQQHFGSKSNDYMTHPSTLTGRGP
jgi:hypothetical protein